ncbi:MAG: hypothetical protein HY665_00295 [Chloroflexi bacterium]|nr:hypothetical protein [Chloroflexota bacterium]
MICALIGTMVALLLLIGRLTPEAVHFSAKAVAIPLSMESAMWTVFPDSAVVIGLAVGEATKVTPTATVSVVAGARMHPTAHTEW